MSINVKKYTKDQMAKMVEEAQEKNAALEAEITALKNYIDEQKKQLAESLDFRAGVYRENNNLKNDNAVLRGKLKDTETALERANAAADRNVSALERLHIELCNAEQRADYAERHPWRNLWAWVKRKLVRHGRANEHVS